MSAAASRPAIAGHDHVFEPGQTDWTLLLLHGTGGDEHDLVPIGRQLAPGAALLSPRGRVREGGVVNRFFARRSANDIDVEDMLLRTDELERFVDGAIAQYGIRRDRVVALGYSNGANAALSTLLRHPGVLASAALLRPVIYHEPEPLPDLAGTPVLAAFGQHDPYSPPPAIERLRDVLERSGAHLDVHVEPTAGHGLVARDLDAVGAWLAGVLAT